MSDDERAKLDGIADRLGDLYQAVGHLDLHPSLQTNLLDVVLGLTQDIETISGRKERHADECH